jgi:hypothetical protein
MTMRKFLQLPECEQVTYLFGIRFVERPENDRFLMSLVHACPDLKEDVLCALLEVLYDRKLSDALDFVRTMSRSGSPKIKYFAAEAIGWLGNGDDFSLLDSLLVDQRTAVPFNEPVCEAARRAIERIKSRAWEP